MFAVPDNTIAELVAPGGTAQNPVRLAIGYARDLRRWAHLLRYDEHERFVGLIEETPQHQAWVMTWLPGQHTDLHDHGGVTGAFTVVRGRLRERVHRAETGEEQVRVLLPGQSRVFGPSYAHQVTGIGAEPAVSVHVYRPVRSNRSLSRD